MQSRAIVRLTIPTANRRPADFPQDAGVEGSRRGGQVGGPSVEAFVGRNGEGDGFFRVAVDPEFGGRPKLRGLERIPQPPRRLRVPDASAGLFQRGSSMPASVNCPYRIAPDR